MPAGAPRVCGRCAPWPGGQRIHQPLPEAAELAILAPFLALHAHAKERGLSRIRIIGGEWRSRLIDVPDSIGLRPTPSRVRETLFNWLGQDLRGLRCLDLFAGSGALGFEAASRGATEVTLVDQAPKVLAHLRQTAATLGCERLIKLHRGSALDFLNLPHAPFDVVFLDPPFNQGWLEKLGPKLGAILSADSLVYVESEHPVATLGRLTAIKSARAGQVHYQLLCAHPLEGHHD